MFKIAFGLSLVLAVLKMIDVISCSWLMVFFPMLMAFAASVILLVIGITAVYLAEKTAGGKHK